MCLFRGCAVSAACWPTFLSLSVSLSGVPALLAYPPHSCCSFSVLSAYSAKPAAPPSLSRTAWPDRSSLAASHITSFSVPSPVPHCLHSAYSSCSSIPSIFLLLDALPLISFGLTRDFRCQCAAPHAPTALD